MTQRVADSIDITVCVITIILDSVVCFFIVNQLLENFMQPIFWVIFLVTALFIVIAFKAILSIQHPSTYVLCPALWVNDHQQHEEFYKSGVQEGYVIPYYDAESLSFVLDQMDSTINDASVETYRYGFITNRGFWVNPNEAAYIAYNARQINSKLITLSADFFTLNA